MIFPPLLHASHRASSSVIGHRSFHLQLHRPHFLLFNLYRPHIGRPNLNQMKEKVFRPTLDDVERISFGKGARKRGTGSRYIPHRLNQDERLLYNQAKENNYLVVKGTAYRRERKGSPLCNTFRQRCDALGQVCVVVEKHCGGDRVKVDFSTLRVQSDGAFVAQIMEMLKSKYPELIDGVSNNTSRMTIDLKAIQNEPIWNMEPRLLIVDSIIDRSMAISVAKDVLKESYNNFVINDKIKISEEQRKSVECKENGGMDNLISPYSNKEVDEKSSVEISDEIDWDDI